MKGVTRRGSEEERKIASKSLPKSGTAAHSEVLPNSSPRKNRKKEGLARSSFGDSGRVKYVLRNDVRAKREKGKQGERLSTVSQTIEKTASCSDGVQGVPRLGPGCQSTKGLVERGESSVWVLQSERARGIRNAPASKGRTLRKPPVVGNHGRGLNLSRGELRRKSGRGLGMVFR